MQPAPAIAPFAAHKDHVPITEILDRAGRLYLDRAADFYRVAAVTLLASWTLDLIVQTWTIGGVPLGALADPRTPEFFRFVASVFGAGVAHGMVYALFNSVAGAILMMMILPREGRERPEIAEAIRDAAPRFAPVLGATVLFFLCVAALIALSTGVVGAVAAAGVVLGGSGSGFVGAAVHLVVGVAAAALVIAFALAILYAGVRWALYQQAAVLGGCGPLESLRRSFDITRDAPGSRLFDRFVVRGAALILLLVVLQATVGAIGHLPSLAVGWILRGPEEERSVLNPTGMPLFPLIPLEILSVLLSATVLPFSVAVFTLLYQDVLGRIEPARPPGRSP